MQNLIESDLSDRLENIAIPTTIIWGKNDKTIYDTANREVKEEASVEIKDNLRLSTVIRSYYYNTPTYMIILVGKIKKINPFRKNEEVISRMFMNPKNFIRRYKYDKSLMSKIIKRSLLAYYGRRDKSISTK